MAYVKKSEVKNFAGNKDMRVSGEFYDALDSAVEELLKSAARRADANGRKTLKAADL